MPWVSISGSTPQIKGILGEIFGVYLLCNPPISKSKIIKMAINFRRIQHQVYILYFRYKYNCLS